MAGGRKQLPSSSLTALAALMAPGILDPRGAITSVPMRGPYLGLEPSTVYIALVYRGSLWACQHHSSPQAGWGSPGPQLQGKMGSRVGKPRERRKQGLHGLEDTRRWGANCP